ncbi:MAG: DUF547 domain-containing protein [Oleiphilus sp.]|nr:MAG: DUF547 domain-containing protein [Oleiphilus sp.]
MIEVRQNAGTACTARHKPERGFSCWRCLRLCLQMFVGASMLLVSASQVHAQDTELGSIHSLYQTLLDDHVIAGEKNGLKANMVDYAAVKKDPRLERLQEKLKVYPKERLDSNEKKIAFYLNAYNILAVAKVAQHWPLYKLKSLGSYFKPVWTHPAGEVCEEQMTLRKLEHDVLRQLGEPRIHFALNCASMSCPDLRKEPYVEDKLETQLAEQTRIFMSQKDKGQTVIGQELWLSSIFKWFEEDFEPVGGVYHFIQEYLPDEYRGMKIGGFLPYDWSVNDHLNAAERNRIKRGRDTWFN